jgi:Tfp pilus assembly protein PilF
MERLHRASLLLAAAVVLAPLTLLAQEGGSPPPAPSGGGSATPPPSGGTAPGGTAPYGGQPGPGGQQPGIGGQRPQQPGQGPMGPDARPGMSEIHRPIFLSGRVLMAGGGPPPEQVSIEVVCMGVHRPFGFTDLRGQFSISLSDQRAAVLPDASVATNQPFGMMGRESFPGAGPPGRGGGLTERDLLGCELRAALPGFRSDVINLGGRRLMDNPNVGVIVLHPLANVEGYTFSITTANAPKDARKAYERGLDRIRKKKPQEAEAHFKKAVAAYPKYALAWHELGRAQELLKKDAEARHSYRQSIEADPKFINPHVNLMALAGRERDWPGVLETSQTVLKLNPFSFPHAWLFNSVANFNLGKLDEAERSAREAMKLDPKNRIPKISHILGVILAEKRDYSNALEHLRGYLMMLAPDGPETEMVKKQVADLEKLAAVRTPQP